MSKIGEKCPNGEKFIKGEKSELGKGGLGLARKEELEKVKEVAISREEEREHSRLEVVYGRKTEDISFADMIKGKGNISDEKSAGGEETRKFYYDQDDIV